MKINYTCMHAHFIDMSGLKDTFFLHMPYSDGVYHYKAGFVQVLKILEKCLN